MVRVNGRRLAAEVLKAWLAETATDHRPARLDADAVRDRVRPRPRAA